MQIEKHTVWKQEELDLLAHSIITAMRKGNSAKSGAMDYSEYTNGQRTTASCLIKWNKIRPQYVSDEEYKTLTSHSPNLNSWSDDEDESLALKILQSISEGDRLQDGISKFCVESGRSPDASVYRWYRVVSKKYQRELKQAKISGREVRSTAIEAPTTPAVQTVSSPTIKPVELVSTPPQRTNKMTKTDLIRFLKNTELVDENVGVLNTKIRELENELQGTKNQCDELKSQLSLMTRQRDELLAENETFVNAFRMVRKHIQPPVATVRTNGQGEVMEVKAQEA